MGERMLRLPVPPSSYSNSVGPIGTLASFWKCYVLNQKNRKSTAWIAKLKFKIFVGERDVFNEAPSEQPKELI